MLFEDQIEQAKDGLQVLQARVQESSTFNKAIERYNSLSPAFQKIILSAALFLIVLIVLAAPIASYKSSIENMKNFKVQKNLTQKVINFSKKSSSLTPKPKKFYTASLSQEVSTLAGSYSIKLLPEQISVTSGRLSKKLVPGALQTAFNIKAKTSNVSQVTALAYSLKKLNKSLVLTGLDFKESSDMPGYFDSTIKVANLSIDPIETVLPKPEVTKDKKKKRRGRGR